jgi:uncharacterized membrane protein YesL
VYRLRKLPFFPTFGNTLKKTFLELYNSMGLSALISITWFLGFVPIIFMTYGLWGGLANLQIIKTYGDRLLYFFIGSLAMALWNGLLIGPFTTAWYGLYQARKTDYPSFKIFSQMFKKFYWRSAGIHLLFNVVIIILFLNITFAVRNFSLIFVISGILSAYILFLIAVASFYFNPLIYLDNTLKKVIKKSFLLTLDNIGLTIWFGIFLGLMLVISISFVFPLLFIYGALLIYTIDNGFEVIYQKYDE